jgi:hypothetical protein
MYPRRGAANYAVGKLGFNRSHTAATTTATNSHRCDNESLAEVTVDLLSAIQRVQKLYRANDFERRESLPELLGFGCVIGGQIEQIAVAGHEEIRSHSCNEVEIGFVVRVTGKSNDVRHDANQYAAVGNPHDKFVDYRVRHQRVLRSDFGVRQNRSKFTQDRPAEI